MSEEVWDVACLSVEKRQSRISWRFAICRTNLFTTTIHSFIKKMVNGIFNLGKLETEYGEIAALINRVYKSYQVAADCLAARGK